MGKLKPISKLNNEKSSLPINNKPINNKLKSQDILKNSPQDVLKNSRNQIGNAIQNFNSNNIPLQDSQDSEDIEESMPDPGSLIDESPQSLIGNLNDPGSLNTGENNENGGKQQKAPLDKLKDKLKKGVKKIIIKSLLSHLMPIIIGVMALCLIGSCSAAMFSGNSNTEIEQTRGQNKKIVINDGNSNSATPSSSSSSSNSSTSFDGDWVYYNQSNPNWDLSGSKLSRDSWIGVSCGVCSYAMIISSYAKDPKYTPTWCELNGLYGSQGIVQGQMCNYVNNHQDIFHLKAESVDGAGPNDWQQNWDKVKKTCDNGGCVIIGQTAQSCVGGNHYIVVRKVDGDNVTIADPVGGVERKISAKKLLSSPIGNQPTKNIYFEKVN